MALVVDTLRRLVGQGALVLDAPTSANTAGTAGAPTGGSGSGLGTLGGSSLGAATAGGSSGGGAGAGSTDAGSGEADWAHEFECIDAIRRLAHHEGEGRALLRPHLREVAAFLVRAVQVCVCCVCMYGCVQEDGMTDDWREPIFLSHTHPLLTPYPTKPTNRQSNTSEPALLHGAQRPPLPPRALRRGQSRPPNPPARRGLRRGAAPAGAGGQAVHLPGVCM